MKRLMLVWVMILCLVPLSGWAEEPASEETVAETASEPYVCGDFQYIVLEDGTAEIVGWTGKAEELSVPAELDGIPVTVVGKITGVREFYLKWIVIPEGVTTIRQFAIRSGDVLNTVELPDSLVIMEDAAILSCEKLQTIRLSSDHPALEFRDGMLISKADKRLILCLPKKSGKSVKIPAGVEIIGQYAFSDCTKMQKVSIPDSVTEIRRGAFQHCYKLKSVTIPGSVKSIGRDAFTSCKQLKTVKIGEGLETLGYFAFAYCAKLEKVNLPRSLTDFGVNPFLGCTKLKTVILPKDHPSLKMVDRVLFDKSGETLLWYPCARTAKSYTIPSGTKTIAPQAFAEAKFKSVTIPDTVTEIGNYAFHDCKNLREIVLPDSVTLLGEGAFQVCERLTRAVLPNALSELPQDLFYACSRLQTVVLPEGIREIPPNAFSGCSALKTLTLPDTVTVIGASAFDGCSVMTSLALPEGLQRIDKYAFLGCKSLPSLTIPAGVTFIGEDAFRTRINRWEKDVVDFTAVVTRGTYAETWCSENSVAFTAE